MMNKRDAALMDRMVIALPERMSGTLRLEHFNVGDDVGEMIRSWAHYGDRAPGPGDYIRLMEEHYESGVRDDTVWMSNTPAELEDHLPVMRRASKPDVQSVLVSGLGLGCVIAGLATFEHIHTIDVIEYNADVITLTSDQFIDDERVNIYHASAYTWVPPKSGGRGKRYDLAWHDIWPDIATGNLKGMWELYGKYKSKVRVQGFWALNLCRHQLELEKGLFDLVKAQEGRYPSPGHTLYPTYHAFRNDGRYAYRIPTDDNTNLEKET